MTIPPLKPPSRSWEIMWFSFAALIPLSVIYVTLTRDRVDPTAIWVVPLMMAYTIVRGLLVRRKRLTRLGVSFRYQPDTPPAAAASRSPSRSGPPRT